MPKSTNGFEFSASINKDGDRVTLVAQKDDHEGRRTEVFHLAPDVVNEVINLLRGAVATAKERRRAIRRASVATEQQSEATQ